VPRAILKKRTDRAFQILGGEELSCQLRDTLVRGAGAATFKGCPDDFLGGRVGACGSIGEPARELARGPIEALVW
jgi:hypothetical protein